MKTDEKIVRGLETLSRSVNAVIVQMKRRNFKKGTPFKQTLNAIRRTNRLITDEISWSVWTTKKLLLKQGSAINKLLADSEAVRAYDGGRWEVVGSS